MADVAEGNMVALGNNAHIFASPHRREALQRLFGELIGCPVATISHPAIAEPMLVVRFPAGGSLSVEFVPNAPDTDEPRYGAWLELRCKAPADLMRQLLAGGISEVKHPGHPHYFVAPGGQVFTVVPVD